MTEKPQGVKNQEMLAKLNEIGDRLDESLNGEARHEKRDYGFLLLLFSFNPGRVGANTWYLSNAEREDVIVLMKELIARLEGQAE